MTAMAFGASLAWVSQALRASCLCVGGFGWLDALVAELLLGFFLDVVEAEVGDGLGEVFDDVERAVVVDDRDADCCGFGVEDVGAVDVGLHPGVVEVFQAEGA